MECFAGAWSMVPKLLDCCAKRIKYIKDLEDNLTSLRSERLRLNNLSEDVRTKVREVEGQQKRVRNTNQVNGWLGSVEAVEKEVNPIMQKGDQELGNKCLGSCCPKNCLSSYKIGKKVLKMIPRVTRLTEEGQFDVVAEELPLPPIEEQLKDNLISLRAAMVKLKYLREDVMNRVREAEEQHMKRTNQVDGWLASVEHVGNGHEELESRWAGNSSLGNRYKLQEEVVKMVPQVITLTEEGKFDVVAHPLPQPTVEELPVDDDVVGFESKFEEVRQSFLNTDYPVIGLVGMGGVGKTTLMKQFNNQFLTTNCTYDPVIWIVVSKPANLGDIRAALRSKLNISDHMWVNKSEDQKKILIFNILKRKKFVVLLDDLWEELELSEVGIPQPSIANMSKIVFTTRTQEVCRSMKASKVIPVGCLPPNDAFSLFYSNLVEDILKSHLEMQGLITDVASECVGLPLALITVGRAMRGKTDARQWKEAKRTLEKYPSTFEGMEGGVFSKLLFSYDSLPSETVQKCFEYCSMYPEDHNILEEELIKLWLAEGLIGEYDSMYDAFIQGRQITESLKQACLLETGFSRGYGKHKEAVKMHDVIRDMALWIACERGKNRNKFFVQVASNQDEITVAPNAMASAEKLSLWGRGITMEYLAGMSFCPNLTTLIIQNTAAEGLPGEIVHSTNTLKVLDLSNNKGMALLPITDDCLTNLEYLNIGKWKMVRLPREVSQLIKLRFLIVCDSIIISRGILSSLSALQMFEQVYERNGGEHTRERKSMEREMLTELEGLKHIMDIRLVLYSATGIHILLNSPKLQKCTTRLALREVESDMLDFGTGTLTKHLERFRADFCHMSEMKLGRPSLGNNLCEVYFTFCEIQNLSSLIYVPNLSILKVKWCSSMSELIGEETKSGNVGTSLFSSLTSLTLHNLPRLRSICPQDALPFPSLQVLKVKECGSLRKLPFDSNTVSTVPQEFIIDGEVDWWNRLEWDSGATRCAFEIKFNRLLRERLRVVGALKAVIARRAFVED